MANGLSQHRVADSLSGDSGTRNSAAEVGNTAKGNGGAIAAIGLEPDRRQPQQSHQALLMGLPDLSRNRLPVQKLPFRLRLQLRKQPVLSV